MMPFPTPAHHPAPSHWTPQSLAFLAVAHALKSLPIHMPAIYSTCPPTGHQALHTERALRVFVGLELN